MTDFLSSNETGVCQVGQVVVNIGADVWVTWINGSSHTGCQIGICAQQTYPGNPIAVVTMGRIPWASYNLGAGNESPIIAGVYPSRGSNGTVIGQCDPAGELVILPSYVGGGVPFSPAPGTPGQFFMTNAVPATAWISLTGDLTPTTGAPGNILVTGIQGKPFSSAAPSTNWVPVYNGSAWVPQALTSAQLPNLAGDVTGSANATTVVGISGSAGNANLNANLVALRDGLTVGSNTRRLGYVASASYFCFTNANDAQPATSVTGGSMTYSSGGAGGNDLRTYRSTVSELTVDNSTGGNANLVIAGKEKLQGAATDYTAYGTAPGTAGFIRATPNSTVVASNGTTILSTDANNNVTLAGVSHVAVQVGAAAALSATNTTTFVFANGSVQEQLTANQIWFAPPLAGAPGSPLQYAINTMTNVATANAAATFNVQANNPIQLFNGHVGPNAAVSIVFPQVRTYYLVDAANMVLDASNVNVNFVTGTGAKVLNWTAASTPQRFWLYVDGANSVYVSNFS